MHLKKRTAYLLFFIAYVGALLIEKPSYTVDTIEGCFSYLLTVIIHFTLFSLLLYGNYTLLIPQLLEKKRFGTYAGALLSLIALYTVFTNHYNYFIHTHILHDEPIRTHAGFWDNFVYGLCCTLVTSMLYVTQQLTDQQEQVKNSRISQLQTELKYLRSQLNPHFLFNGLNTIYGCIDRSNSQARDMMVRFSDLLRYNLYEADVDLIALERELKYLQNYVDLQKARSNDNILVGLNITCQTPSLKIAPLIFMTFVENAFKYVTRGDDTLNEITIILGEANGQIDFICRNSYDEVDPSNGGIGLSNAVRRLELLYKGRHQLDINKHNNQYDVHLTLSP